MEALYDFDFLIRVMLFMIAAVAIIYFVVASFCGSQPQEPNIAGFIYDEPETLWDKIKKLFN